MFTYDDNQHPHYDSSCTRFASVHVLSEVARDADMSEQVLRNKLNPSQPHQMTVRNLIAVYRATGDDTLFDGMLMDCGLTAVRISPADDSRPVALRALDATAHVAGATAQAANVLNDARITKTARNAVVGGLMAGIEHMVLLMAEVENKFQAVPGIACAADIARTALGA
ncbi:MAG: phage regulatory CII family protein [Plesiomonas shigelloides]